MGFGLWQKIKNGLSKVIGGIGKGVAFVRDKVVKPVLGVVKPVLDVAAPVLSQVLPGAAGTILKGVGMASNLIAKSEALEPRLKNMQARLTAGVVNNTPR
jgi:phage-related protein